MELEEKLQGSARGSVERNAGAYAFLRTTERFKHLG
jgi:hypothetical protein